MRNAALALLLSTSAAAPTAAPSETETLAALTRLYGVVRWFHPTDAAHEIDWNRFAVRAVKATRAARSPADLQRTLAELFAPVGVGIVIGTELPAVPSAETPAGAGLVAWRHLGLGFGGEGGGGAYSSARTQRRAPTEIDGFASMTQSVPASSLRGKNVRFSAQVKADSADPEGAAALWLRVDRGEEPGFFDNMVDRPIRSPEWREYAIEGKVDADALHLAFGVLARGQVRAGFDAVRLEVQQADGTWQSIPLANSGFEEDGTWRKVGTSRRAVITYPAERPPEGRRFLNISPPGGGAQPLFEAPLRAGAHAEVDLGLGLRARVPTVLTEAESAGSAAQRTLLDGLKAELDRMPAVGDPLDADVRAADVVVAWSVFRHFYPYWAELGLDWDSRLPALLEASAAARTREAHHDVLRRLVAEIRDGHGRVIDAQAVREASLPIAVRWLEARLVVTASAAPEKVRVGDVITAMDGRPAAVRFAEQEALQSGSPQWRAARAAAELMRGREGSPVTVGIDREGGPVTVELLRDRREPVREARPEPLAQIREGVWYVDLERAGWPAVQSRLADLAQARAVIFDLRGYPSEAGAKVLPHLLSAPEQGRWMHIPRIAEPFGRIADWKALGWDLSPASPRIAGKVAFLADGRAISYAESVMGYVEGLRLGAIVGGATAGANGNVNAFAVPSGMRLAFTGMRVTRHDGSPFHLAGVRPTVPAAPTLAGIRAGRDEVLERALAAVGVEDGPGR